MKIALDRGHGYIHPKTKQFDPGATSGAHQETVIASQIIDEIVKLIKGKIPYHIPKPNFDTTEILREAVANKCDYYLCVHINASHISTARGAEVYWKNQNSKQFSQDMLDALCTIFPIRGLHHAPTGMVNSQNFATMPYAFLEVGFISNAQDLQILLTRKKDIARAIVSVLEKHSGVKIVKKVKLIFNQQGPNKDVVFRSINGGPLEVATELDGHMPFIKNTNHLSLRNAVKLFRPEGSVDFNVNTKETIIEWEE